MDFVADALFDGRKLRMLTVVDLFTRECLAIDVRQSLKGEDVVRVLTAITYERGTELDFSHPGKPTDNANVESFNGRLRQECLNATWFMSLDDARGKIEAWRQYYNESRPHSSLDWTTPAEFARRCIRSCARRGGQATQDQRLHMPRLHQCRKVLQK